MDLSSEMLEAQMAGRTSRLALEVESDLWSFAARYPGLFSRKPLAPVPPQVASAVAFGAPWHTADELAVAARTSLWIFAVDLAIDTEAARPEEVSDVLGRCRAAADGHAGEGDELALALADCRSRAARSPSFTPREPVWREELERMLAAMAQEWCWKARLGLLGPNADSPAIDALPGAAVDLPDDLDGYLAISDNFGSAWVNVAHWLAVGDPGILDHLEHLRAVSRTVQALLRLANDTATRTREEKAAWGDINAFTFGVGEDQVRDRIGELADQVRHQAGELRPTCPHGAQYLLQQAEYSLDFYGARRDYWGDR